MLICGIIGPNIDEEPTAHQMAVLDRIQVSRIFDLEGLNQTISELDDRLSLEGTKHMLAMVIVDNIASIVNPEINQDRVHGKNPLFL